MKTKRACAKRFKFTATGKIRFKRTNQSTNTPLSKSSRRNKRALRIGAELEGGEVAQVKTLIPYWKKHK
jgi:ribosomal protein L35